MAKIRDDFHGVVYARAKGKLLKLAGGETVPNGVKVDSRLTAETGPKRRTKQEGADDVTDSAGGDVK